MISFSVDFGLCNLEGILNSHIAIHKAIEHREKERKGKISRDIT